MSLVMLHGFGCSSWPKRPMLSLLFPAASARVGIHLLEMQRSCPLSKFQNHFSDAGILSFRLNKLHRWKRRGKINFSSIIIRPFHSFLLVARLVRDFIETRGLEFETVHDYVSAVTYNIYVRYRYGEPYRHG